MALLHRNFLAASRRPNFRRFGYFDRDLSWIDTADSLLPSLVTVSYSATPSFNVANGARQSITLTGDVTSSTFTYNGASPEAGTGFELVVIQDATGGRSFTLPSDVRAEPGFQVDTRAGYRTIMSFRYVSSRWDMWNVISNPA